MFFHFFPLRNNNCWTDLYERDLQTIIILFTRNVSSHKTDWIFSELPLLALSCLLYRRVNNLMNALEGECLCLCLISINVNKQFIVIFVFCLRCHCSIVAHVCPFFYIDVVVDCLLLYSFFILFLQLLFIILITPFPFS